MDSGELQRVLELQEEMQCTYNVTIQRVRATIVTAKNQ
jgi:hypothetical protein